MAITISLCMIVKNEEDVLARCLDSAAPIADEIIIVDTGSSDQTLKIARQYTQNIYFFPWQDHFANARNASFSHASMEYCMWLDADDVILPEDFAHLLQLKQTLDPSVDVVMLPYQMFDAAADAAEFWYYRERIIRNSPKYRWEGAVHETITPTGYIYYGEPAITHKKARPADPNRNLRILEKIKNTSVGLSPRQQFYYGRELYAHHRYHEAIEILEKFWENPEGWAENKLAACCILSHCYQLLGQEEMAFRALLRSFILDIPRAEVCCELGRLFVEQTSYALAAYWYELALLCAPSAEKGGFVHSECYGYLPCIQLCVCYDKLGDHQRAEYFNQRAGAYRPSSPVYQSNKIYFERLRQQKML